MSANFGFPQLASFNVKGGSAGEGNSITVFLNNSFPLQLYLLDEGEEFFMHQDIWPKETLRQPRIIPSGLMYYDTVIEKEIYRDQTTQCNSDPSYNRAGMLQVLFFL